MEAADLLVDEGTDSEEESAEQLLGLEGARAPVEVTSAAEGQNQKQKPNEALHIGTWTMLRLEWKETAPLIRPKHSRGNPSKQF